MTKSFSASLPGATIEASALAPPAPRLAREKSSGLKTMSMPSAAVWPKRGFSGAVPAVAVDLRAVFFGLAPALGFFGFRKLGIEMAGGEEQAFAVGRKLRAVFVLRRGGDLAGHGRLARQLVQRIGVKVHLSRHGGGQQQRLCIARAIAVSPEVILMDEPCSALDPIATARIEELIDELRLLYCIVIVTHSFAQAARVSDRTAFFHLGELVEEGDTKRIFSTPRDKRTQDYITGRFG